MEKMQGLQHIFTASDPPHQGFFCLDSQGEEAQSEILLTESVRWIAGKRLVAKGNYQNQEVFVKLFFNGHRGQAAWKHELFCLGFMAEKGIAAPEILVTGTAEQGKVYVLLMKPVAPAVSLGVLWQECQSPADKKVVLQKIMGLLAEHHDVGLAQADLHWDNFLCKNDRIYTLDAGDVQISGEPLSQPAREENLSQFFSLLLPGDDDLIVDSIACYNSLASRPVSVDHVQVLTGRKRYRKHRKYVGRKIFRSCTEFYCKRDFRKLVLCNRAHVSDVESFLFEPDLSLDMPETTMLKKGNACTVWSVKTATRRYVVKRYNIKSFLHGLGRLCRPTNAAQSWRAAHLLQCYGILTPRPVALVEDRFGPCRGRAYFITEYVEGLHFWDYFFDENRPLAEKEQQALYARDLFGRLFMAGIRHGDMKGQNLMVSDAGVGLIDLDDVRQYPWHFLASYWHDRDRKRFMRNWQNHPELLQMFTKVFSQ